MAKGKRLMTRPGRSVFYQPKHLMKPGKRLLAEPRRFHGGTAAAVGLCALALAGAANLSVAFLMEHDSVDNTFVIASVDPSVVETFAPERRVKENVRIQNGGNTPVYIRALLVITWRDGQGKILSALPEAGTDYAMVGPVGDWAPGGDGYYYCTRPVQPGAFTGQLVERLTDQNTDATRQLCVEVIAQSVQASPVEAVTDVFPGVTVGADGTLTPPALEVTP